MAAPTVQVMVSVAIHGSDQPAARVTRAASERKPDTDNAWRADGDLAGLRRGWCEIAIVMSIVAASCRMGAHVLWSVRRVCEVRKNHDLRELIDFSLRSAWDSPHDSGL